jgi:hypothetical protein
MAWQNLHEDLEDLFNQIPYTECDSVIAWGQYRSESLKEAIERYRNTPRGREVQRAANRKFMTSERGKEIRRAAQKRYEQSPKGQAAIARKKAKRRAKNGNVRISA